MVITLKTQILYKHVYICIYSIHQYLYFQKPDSLFGSDPFAPKSPARPAVGPKSPAPVLPPKQKKNPPPRPAPPKNRPTPSPSQQLGGFDSDPFAG